MDESRALHSSVEEIAESAAMLAEDFGEFPDLLETITDTFREFFFADLEALRAAASAGDCERVRFLAHKFKGSFLAFHLGRASARAAALEEQAGQGDLSAAGASIEAISYAFGEVNATVEHAARILAEGMDGSAGVAGI